VFLFLLNLYYFLIPSIIFFWSNIMKKILLMGPQGAGKGTVGAIIKEKLGIPHISMGDILRDTVKSNSPLGQKVKAIMDKGDLVPIEIVAQMLKERLLAKDCANGYLLDGYPRNLEQAEIMDQVDTVDKVIILEVSRQISIDRLTTRRQCRKCSAVFNVKSMQSKKEGICDSCGGELYQRDDDKEEAIIKRLAIYEKETTPLIQRYKNKVVHIDATKPVDVVTDLLLKAMQ
jgi:adenylate kinase